MRKTKKAEQRNRRSQVVMKSANKKSPEIPGGDDIRVAKKKKTKWEGSRISKKTPGEERIIISNIKT